MRSPELPFFTDDFSISWYKATVRSHTVSSGEAVAQCGSPDIKLRVSCLDILGWVLRTLVHRTGFVCRLGDRASTEVRLGLSKSLCDSSNREVVSIAHIGSKALEIPLQVAQRGYCKPSSLPFFASSIKTQQLLRGATQRAMSPQRALSFWPQIQLSISCP